MENKTVTAAHTSITSIGSTVSKSEKIAFLDMTTFIMTDLMSMDKGKKMKLYIAVLDEFPDYMTPTLVAHAVLGAHLEFTKAHTDFDRIVDDGPYKHPHYIDWLENSFKKCVVRVNQKEFDKIAALPDVYLGHENNTLDGRKSCAVVCPMPNKELPNVLKFAKLWKPKL